MYGAAALGSLFFELTLFADLRDLGRGPLVDSFAGLDAEDESEPVSKTLEDGFHVILR